MKTPSPEHPCNPRPPESPKRFTVSIRCNHCGQAGNWSEGNFPNQVEHFIMAHQNCPKPT